MTGMGRVAGAGVALGATVGVIAAGIGVIAAGVALIYKFATSRLESIIAKAASPGTAAIALRSQVRQQRRDFAVGQAVAPEFDAMSRAREDLSDQIARFRIAFDRAVAVIITPLLKLATELLEGIADFLNIGQLNTRGVNQHVIDSMNAIVNRNFDMDLAGTP